MPSLSTNQRSVILPFIDKLFYLYVSKLQIARAVNILFMFTFCEAFFM